MIRSMLIIRFDTTCCSAVISDSEDVTCNQHNPEHEDMPHGTRTPPTPHPGSPPPTSPLSSRVRAVAHIRPVSVPDIVRDMPGKDPPP